MASSDWSWRRGTVPVVARVALTVAVILTIAACSGSAGSPLLSNGGNGAGQNGAPSSGGSSRGSGGAGAPAASPGPADNSGTGSVQGKPSTGPLNEPVTNPALIVRTGSLTLEVSAVDESLVRAGSAIAGLGGYVSGSQQSTAGDRVLASVTYRIPSARWEDALSALKGLGKLIDGRTDSVEVTGQVLDLGARIDNLKASERALQAIMNRATKISDVLEVQNQLTGVRGEIEQLSTQQVHLREQAALSTLSVVFQTPAVAKVVETSKGWNPGAEFDRAVGQLLAIGQGLVTIGIWLAIVVLPMVLSFGLLLVLVGLVARRIGRARNSVSGPPAVAGGTGG
jgi:uncharacterized protein DUF4349